MVNDHLVVIYQQNLGIIRLENNNDR
jgi:hypothetical protein